MEALILLEENSPDALIIGLYTPGLDGFSLLENLRLNAQTKNIPVIIFTSDDPDEKARSQFMTSGQLVLQKNLFSEKELLDMLEQSLHIYTKQPEQSA